MADQAYALCNITPQRTYSRTGWKRPALFEYPGQDVKIATLYGSPDLQRITSLILIDPNIYRLRVNS